MKTAKAAYLWPEELNIAIDIENGPSETGKKRVDCEDGPKEGGGKPDPGGPFI